MLPTQKTPPKPNLNEPIIREPKFERWTNLVQRKLFMESR